MNEATRRLWGQMLDRCGYVLRHQQCFPGNPLLFELVRGQRLVAMFTIKPPISPDQIDLADLDSRIRAAVLRDAREYPPRTSRTY